MLQFTRDPAVPSTNNEAERALWPLKVQQRISGSFRSAEVARNHVALRTVLDTARKQGWNLLETLRASPDERIERLATRQPAAANRAALQVRSINIEPERFQLFIKYPIG